MNIMLGSLLSGGLADFFLAIGGIGAGGAVVASTGMGLIAFALSWSKEDSLTAAGVAAIVGAPLAILLVLYTNLVF